MQGKTLLQKCVWVGGGEGRGGGGGILLQGENTAAEVCVRVGVFYFRGKNTLPQGVYK